MSEFRRKVWCLLGIPIDVINFDDAVELLQTMVEKRERCFLSTPNLNFIVEARKSMGFRDSVIDSDLVLLDGMPPVWVARMLGIPGVEKISGSDLVETLWNRALSGGGKTRVFLFGGEQGIAEQACARINNSSAGLECVGFLNPGFGSVEEMSESGLLQQINDSHADFVLVSLGAKKGQAWIMANKDRLDAPIVSHLGAVVNFAAGNVRRAPGWMQRIGVEWLWRIWQEPTLWRRYFFDGIAFCGLLLGRVAPYLWWQMTHRRMLASTELPGHRIEVEQGAITLYLDGACLHRNLGPIRQVFEQLSLESGEVIMDLSGVRVVDGAFLGLCLLLSRSLKRRSRHLAFRGLNNTLRNLFRWNAVDYLL